jgi:hypothetical protein
LHLPLVFFSHGGTIGLTGPFYTGLITGGSAVFDSLSDRIRQDEQIGVTKLDRVLRWGLVTMIAFMLFGGLYLVVQKLE